MTQNVVLSFPPDIVDRLYADSRRFGMTNSKYVATLVTGQRPLAKPAAPSQELALVANRISRARVALEGEDMLDAMRELVDAQERVIALLRAQFPEYEGAVDAQVADDTWESPG